jgi:hypothetical protein
VTPLAVNGRDEISTARHVLVSVGVDIHKISDGDIRSWVNWGTASLAYLAGLVVAQCSVVLCNDNTPIIQWNLFAGVLVPLEQDLPCGQAVRPDASVQGSDSFL